MAKLYQAVTAFHTETPDGKPCTVRAGEIAEEGSWVVDRFGGYFQPVDATYKAPPKQTAKTSTTKSSSDRD